MKEKLKELEALSLRIKHIIESNLEWEDKFDFIFSEDISVKVKSIIELDYYDPDTSYEDDVKAFVNAFNAKLEKIRIAWKDLE